MNTHHCPDYAQIHWSDSGAPHATAYRDFYYAPDGGLADLHHVFVDRHLRDRFVHWSRARRSYVLAETGFGTGLNFLAAAMSWLECSSSGRLCYFSFENAPLRLEDLQRAHQSLPLDWQGLAMALQQQYPPRLLGPHRIELAAGRIQLTLVLGDATEQLPHLDFKADTWFLDGFAPSRNAELWSPQLFALVGHHAHAATSIHTYTVSQLARQGLAQGGFTAERWPGSGRKREMLRVPGDLPQFEDTQISDAAGGRRRIAILGAGIAGATLAWHLSRDGHCVSVYGLADHPADGASGNPQGALYCKPGVAWSPENRLHLSCYSYAQRFYGRIAALEAPLWNPCGLYALANSATEKQRIDRLFQCNRYPPELFTACPEGLFFPGGGWLDPAQVCSRLISEAQAKWMAEPATRCTRDPSGRWLVESDMGTSAADYLILATGQLPAPLKLEGCSPVFRRPTRPVRGQISAFRPTPASAVLDTVRCGDGYLLPRHPRNLSLQWCGASFQAGVSDLRPRAEDDRENLRRVRDLLAAEGTDPGTCIANRVALRHATRDYLPIMGAVSCEGIVDTADASVSGLWCLGGLGSKGLMLAPLLARVLADLLGNEPAALHNDSRKRIAP